jgi:hypothetical protein
MPDPKTLNVGDKIRFTGVPDEWSDPKYKVSKESKLFLRYMITRKYPSRVYEIDENGHPWIVARIKIKGIFKHHAWAIMETTGWRKVEKRT